MIRKSLLIAILALALVNLACGVTIDLPITEVKTGPTVTEDINVALLEDPEEIADVTLAFGAGSLELSPGAEEGLIEGTATYNVPDFKPEITIYDERVRIEQGDLNIRGIPDFDSNLENSWDLQFGSAPMELTVNAGAYAGEFELGGLALHNLQISDGAADVEVSFSEPNLVEMNRLEYNTGASDVTLTGLANANFENMLFRSGAGSYRLEFDGDLKRDASVKIESGVSSMIIIVPEGVNAELTFEGSLSNVSARGEWEKSGGVYVLEGEGPTIEISVVMGAGSLELRSK